MCTPPDHQPHPSLSDLYRRLPLDPGRSDIRVLTLQGHAGDDDGDGDGPPECTLRVVPLDESVRFNALSYVWGDPADTTTVVVNGIPVAVTRSLAGALSSCAAPLLSATPIWADALCINQLDTAERAQQVRIMGDIYAAAARVVVWLGEGNPHTDRAIQLMRSPAFCGGLGSSGRPPTRDEVAVDVVLKHDLCRRPWWQRLWVRQEFVLAARWPYICCGASFIPWPDLLSCFASLPRPWDYPEWDHIWAECRREVTGREDDAPATTGIHPFSLDHLRADLHRDGTLVLPAAVRYVLRNAAATNPLDFVYGLLGLLPESDRDRITLDYGTKPLTLFRQVSEMLWTEHRTAMFGDLLPALEFRPDGRGGPSWVVDFAAQPVRGWKDYRYLQASGLLAWPRGVRAPRDAGSGPLAFRGLLFDVVKTAVATPGAFHDVEELVPALTAVDKAFLDGVSLDIPPDHRLKPLENLKREERVLHTLTRSALEDWEPLFPGLDDETVWGVLLGRDALPASALDPPQHSGSSARNKVLGRLARMLRAKFLDRRVLITEAGFVGIGVRQIRHGDVVTLPFEAKAPLVLRPRGNGWALVGCAYVSGLMELEQLRTHVGSSALPLMEFRIS